MRRRSLERRKPAASGHETRTVPGPEALASEAERQAQLEEALPRLPHRQRVIVLLRYQEGLTCAEIGELFSLTPNAVSLQLHRARRALRDDLGEERSDAP